MTIVSISKAGKSPKAIDMGSHFDYFGKESWGEIMLDALLNREPIGSC